MTGWDSVPPGTTLAYETRIGGHCAIRSWARREADPRPLLRRLTLWQEVDFGALGRPGGRVRVMMSLDMTTRLVPRRLTIASAAGRATIHINSHEIRIRLVDGTRILQEGGGIDIVLPDNAPALLAFYLRILGDDNRLPGRFAAYLPGTLTRLDYAIDHAEGGYRTSLGEEVEIGPDGLLSSLRVGAATDIEIIAVPTAAPRWRTLGGSSVPRQSAAAERWGPARDIATMFDGRRHHARMSNIPSPLARLLFIGGSGTHDRFGRAGSVDLGYGEIAERLGAAGIACLLYDKPGSGKTRADPQAARPDFRRVIALAAHWLDYLVGNGSPDIPLVIAGHSQGGQVGAWLAAHRPHVSALCLMATAARPIDAVLKEQVALEARDIGLSEDAHDMRIGDLENYFVWLRSGRPTPLSGRLAALAHLADWYQGLLETAPTETLPLVTTPVAIMQGGRDIQVAPEDADRLAALISGQRPSVVRFAGLDHLFKPTAATTNIKAYGDRRRHVARQATDWLAEWILSLAGPIGKEKGHTDSGKGN